RIPASFADDDRIAFLVPLQDRARADTEFSSHFRWNRYLTLSGNLRLRYCHMSNYHGNGLTVNQTYVERRLWRDQPDELIPLCLKALLCKWNRPGLSKLHAGGGIGGTSASDTAGLSSP